RGHGFPRRNQGFTLADVAEGVVSLDTLGFAAEGCTGGVSCLNHRLLGLRCAHGDWFLSSSVAAVIGSRSALSVGPRESLTWPQTGHGVRCHVPATSAARWTSRSQPHFWQAAKTRIMPPHSLVWKASFRPCLSGFGVWSLNLLRA